MRGVFIELVPPERIAFSNIAVDGNDEPLLEGLTTVTFSNHRGKTRMTLQTTAIALAASAVRMLDGMQEGWTQSIDRLETYLMKDGRSLS